MMAKRLEIPEGHGEVLAEPPFSRWAETVRENALGARGWSFEVAGMSAGELRELARHEALEVAARYTSSLGIPTRSGPQDSSQIVMTGHQPVLFGPGVWVKHLALQRLADETDAIGLDLVVDTDVTGDLTLDAPCLDVPVRKCATVLMEGQGRPFVDVPVPSPEAIEGFREEVATILKSLPSDEPAKHFAAFHEALTDSSRTARNVAELVTGARRRYELPAGSDYLELPVSGQAAGEAFARFFAHVVLDAEEFRDVHNEELAAYRRAESVRSPARPFPALRCDGAFVETPFWLLGQAGRSALWVREDDGSLRLFADEEQVASLPRDPSAVAAEVRASGLRLAPRALSLTLFNRLFVADLFVHGVGGARYDRVTDAVARRVFGVEPPTLAVTSMTLHLPLGGPAADAEGLAAVRREIHELTHNPDRFVDRVDDPDGREEAGRLAQEKARLVADIGVPGAEKKTLGARIREINEALAAMLEEVVSEARGRLDEIEQASRAAEVVSDRAYPFCLWGPLEVLDEL